MPENPTTGARPGRPDIHVWMNLDEAADATGLSLADIHEKIDLADLETRINRDGVAEVLVLLPQRASADHAADVEIDAQVTDAESGEVTLDSLLTSVEETSIDEARQARRSARLAWATAMAMFLGVCGTSIFAAYTWADAQNQLQAMSEKISQLSETGSRLSGERDKLAGQITEYRQAAARAQGELAVERKIEDTLFKAALSARATAPAHVARTAVADTSN